MSLSASPHLRGILIAGVLALIAAGLGIFTLSMNQSASSAAPPKIIPYKDRHPATAPTATTTTATTTTTTAATTVAPKPKPKPNPHYVAALKAGLPAQIARQLATKSVVVVQLFSKQDPVSVATAVEAAAGATRGEAGFAALDVASNGLMSTLTRALGQVPTEPETLIFRRPAMLITTLNDFNDAGVVQQAVVTAFQSHAPTQTTPVVPAATAPAPVVPAPTTTDASTLGASS